MKQQTAVEWLIDNWIKFNDIDIELDDFANLRPVLEQAKQMEKEQIIKAYKEARQIGCKCYDDLDDRNAEPYYKETYKL